MSGRERGERTLLWSSLVLWAAAPLLLFLTLHRPFAESRGRAARLPAELGGFRLAKTLPMTERYYRLLGTRDAVWREYRRAEDPGPVWVVALFHQENWKSVHPPHICLEGSDLTIVRDDATDVDVGERRWPVGRILSQSNRTGDLYLSLYVFGARGFVTDSYTSFFLHHAPLALLRRSTSGYLLRVETWVEPDGVAAAEQRCKALLRALIPAAEGLLR